MSNYFINKSIWFAAQKNWSPVPVEILRAKKLSLQAKAVYIEIVSYIYQSDKSTAWPKQKTMADDLGIAISTVNKYLKELRNYGLIAWIQLGLAKPNVYALLDFPMTGYGLRGPVQKNINKMDAIIADLTNEYYENNPRNPDVVSDFKDVKREKSSISTDFKDVNPDFKDVNPKKHPQSQLESGVALDNFKEEEKLNNKKLINSDSEKKECQTNPNDNSSLDESQEKVQLEEKPTESSSTPGDLNLSQEKQTLDKKGAHVPPTAAPTEGKHPHETPDLPGDDYALDLEAHVCHISNRTQLPDREKIEITKVIKAGIPRQLVWEVMKELTPCATSGVTSFNYFVKEIWKRHSVSTARVEANKTMRDEVEKTKERIRKMRGR